MICGPFVAALTAIIAALIHVEAGCAVMSSGWAAYYFPRGSVRTRIPDRSGHNHDLAAIGDFTPSPLGVQFRSGTSSDHLLIPASLWKTINTVVVMATFNQGSGYRAILGMRSLACCWIRTTLTFALTGRQRIRRACPDFR
jgi:hypothetical protein